MTITPHGTEETPLIKAFGDAFDLLVKSYERLPAYPRTPAKAQTTLFRPPLGRGKPRIGKNSLAKACLVFQAEVANLQKSLVTNRLSAIVQDAATHFAEGRMSAYELDVLRNRALQLANHMEAHQ